MGDGFIGRKIFGGKSTVIRGGYGRIYGRLNGVDLVLVPLLGTGLIQPVQCFNPTIGGACGTGTASTAFRMGKDGLTAPIAAASPTLPQPDYPGLSICNAPTPGAFCPEAGAGEGFDPHFRPNVVDSVTVSIQRQMGQRNTLEIGYIGRRIRNEYQPLNTNAVPYMFTKGGQQFQQAYANIEKAMGCATSFAACYNASPTMTSLKNLAPQPFFEAALSGTGYCTGFANCTQAVINQEFSNLSSQNVWSMWGDLDQNFPVTGNPGFNFGSTMQSSPGAGGSTVCPTCPSAQLSSGLGMNASIGYGNYNAGYVSWRMSSWHGVTSQTNLTWGKALGTGGVVQASSSYTVDDPFNLHTMYGMQGWDRKYVLNSFVVYEPPFFKGQQGILGHLLGGWNIAPLLSAASGWTENCYATVGASQAQAFGAADGVGYGDNEQCVNTGPWPSIGRYAGVQGGTDAAGNAIGTPTYTGTTAQFNSFKDPLALWNTLRPAILGIDNGHDGGNGIFRGLPFWNVDLSIKKNMKFTERFSGTFQTVFTNVFNHNQFTDPTIDPSNPSCLGVQSAGCNGGPQINTPRNIELSLRINF